MPNTRDDARRRLLAGVPVTDRRLELAAIPTARHGWPLRVIDGAGDDPSMERPAAFLAALATPATAGRAER